VVESRMRDTGFNTMLCILGRAALAADEGDGSRTRREVEAFRILNKKEVEPQALAYWLGRLYYEDCRTILEVSSGRASGG
jgi:hypothetical protein